jgi:hypothetical protein
MSVEIALATALGALLGSFVSGLAGFAFGLIALGIWLHVLTPTLAAPLVVGCSLAVQLLSIPALWRAIQPARLWPFVLGGVVGVPLGSFLLGHLDAGLFRRVLGGFLLAYGAVMLILPPMAPFARAGRPADGAVGLIGGIMGGLAGLSGALPTVWCGLRGWTKDEQRAIYQPFNIAVHATTLAAHWNDGYLDRDFALGFLVCLPALAFGGWLGLGLYRRIDDARFRRVVLWLLLISGATLMV